MNKTMTITKTASYRLVSTFLIAALGVAVWACSDDDGGSSAKDASVKPLDSGLAIIDANVAAADTGAAPGAAAACLDKVYSELSDGCSACACGVDTTLAPSCGKPCWDFLACSFAAQAGKCAAAAAGGAATRPEFEACTMVECGAQLAVPGAEVVSSYRTIIGACAVPMGTAKAACGDDIAKFTAGLKKP
jgi:hypothetical protein